MSAVCILKRLSKVGSPRRLLQYFLGRKIARVIPDKAFVRLSYWASFGKLPDLDEPKTYNEKLQWLKLYDRRPEYVGMVDKYEAKKHAAGIIGEQYVIPTLGVWDSFDDIDFSKLPERFVLKCTHDSGGLVICRDRSSFDFSRARSVICGSLKNNYYWHSREWPYKLVKPRIIAEEYLETETGELPDYKFFSFDGVTRAMYVATDRFKEGAETKFDFFNDEFEHLPFTNSHPNAEVTPEKPRNFDEMKRLAGMLSKGFAQMRVDFYEANGRVFFGEITFFHMSGLQPFHPEEWDRIFGDWIVLPEKTE